MTKHYKLNPENKYNGTNVSCDVKKNKGYKVTPKNKVKYEGVVVNEMFVIKPSFIEKLLKRKISVKLDNYLQYIISILDNDDSSDSEKITVVLSDLNRYREIIKNSYRQYLDAKYIELLLKKIELLEYELKKKLMYLNAYNYSKMQYFYEEPIKEERKRSR